MKVAEMNKQLLIKLRENVSLFKHLHIQDIMWILKIGEELELEKGSLVLKQGESGDDFYLLLEGELAIYHEIGEQKKLLNTLGNLHLVGEISPITGEKRSATIECNTHCQLLKYTSRLFKEAEISNAELGFRLYKNIISILVNDYLLPAYKKIS